MKVSKRIFDLETESAFAVLAKANKLLKWSPKVTLHDGLEKAVKFQQEQFL